MSISIFSQLAYSSPARTPRGFVSGTSETETIGTFDENTWCLGLINGVSNSVSDFINSRERNGSDDNYCRGILPRLLAQSCH